MALEPSRKDSIGLSFIAIFLFGFLGWSIYNDKPQWIQNSLAYAALLATVIGFLLHKPDLAGKDSLKDQIGVNEEKRNGDAKSGEEKQMLKRTSTSYGILG